MTDESRLTLGPLTDSQRARVDYARRDLETARAADLALLEQGGLILLVERLRIRLDDMLSLVQEVTAENPRSES
ncbi:hypothetical protein ACH49_21350 [Streptomyces leeuwenhoekii]|uniref:Uncharacterized protein n=1 Tax=Streptomyces leeuwenhoekii TaxID=1437453 RepID=A0ABR5HUT5_STRLW|nr:hypothetical protein [Streptomyces leeuwenhoekii]KMS75654.1 hypothetical protein ACH49_21350 [Streptomyces leeuwenhoekii]